MSLPVLAEDCSTVLPAAPGFTGELQQQPSHCKPVLDGTKQLISCDLVAVSSQKYVNTNCLIRT